MLRKASETSPLLGLKARKSGGGGLMEVLYMMKAAFCVALLLYLLVRSNHALLKAQQREADGEAAAFHGPLWVPSEPPLPSRPGFLGLPRKPCERVLFLCFELWLFWPLVRWLSPIATRPCFRAGAGVPPPAASAMLERKSAGGDEEHPGLAGHASSQLFADDVARSVAFETWLDLLPSTEDSFILEADTATRPPLSFARLRQFASSEELLLGSRFGIGLDDRICSMLPNGPEAAVCFMVLPLRCTFAPLNPALTEEEAAFEFEDLPCHTLIVTRGGLAQAGQRAAAAQRLQVLELLPSQEAAGLFSLRVDSASPTRCPPLGCNEWAKRDDLALVLHTSGTTKKPKIVPLTHENLVVGALCIRSTLQLGPGDVCVNLMPLYHIHGLAVNLLATGLSGGSVLCAPGFQLGALGWFRSSGATWYSAVPTIHQGLVGLTEDQQAAAPQLRFARSCSAALAPALALRLERALRCAALPTYAMTESMPIASCPLPPHRRCLRSVGLSAGPQLRLDDGEVCVRGACVTSGYERRAHMDTDPNAEAFTPDGWLRTGDRGYLDAQGHLCLTGRSKELVNRGGEKISPLRVEAALCSHPSLRECLAFAANHEQLGETVGLAVVQEGHSLSSVRAIGRAAGLGEASLPECVVLVGELPKGPTGKPLRIGFARRVALPALDAVRGSASVWDARSGVAVPLTGGGCAEAALKERLADVGAAAVISEGSAAEVGWSSLELMRLAAEARDERLLKGEEAAKLAMAGALGHVWFCSMLLVALEWMAAWADPHWFGAVGSVQKQRLSFNLGAWPLVDRLRCIGALCGDPFFMMISGIQDAEALCEQGGAAKLFRRGVLFGALFLLALFCSRVLLRGPYLDLGWTTRSYVLEETNATGVLFQGMFIGVRALFALLSAALAWVAPGGGRVLQLPGLTFPVAPLLCGVALPAVVVLLAPSPTWRTAPPEPVASVVLDMGLEHFLTMQAAYVRELSLYYFICPAFVGGLLFPRWRVRLSQQLPAAASVLVGFAALTLLWQLAQYVGTATLSEVRSITGTHIVWTRVVQKYAEHRGSSEYASFWRCFVEDHDLYLAALSGLCLALAILAAPTRSTPLSRAGAQILTVYLTLPLVMIPLLHFVLPYILAPQRALQPDAQALALLACCVLAVLLAARPLPECWILWAEQGLWRQK